MTDVFDQKQPKSALARRLNEALSDTNEWTVAPPRRRAAVVQAQAQAPGTLAAPSWVQQPPR